MLDYAALVAALTAFGAHARPSEVLLAFVVAQALAMVPITPGGLGFVESGLTALLVVIGIPADTAVIGTLLYRLVSFWLPIPDRRARVGRVADPPGTDRLARPAASGGVIRSDHWTALVYENAKGPDNCPEARLKLLRAPGRPDLHPAAT